MVTHGHTNGIRSTDATDTGTAMNDDTSLKLTTPVGTSEYSLTKVD